MEVRTSWIERATSGRDDVLDITDEVARAVAASGLRAGSAIVFVPGSTGAVTTIECEPGVVQDLRDALERAVPRAIPYAHDAAWGDGNGYSHVRAAWIGPSLAVPFEDGKLLLGTWQQIVFCDHDNRPRRRRLIVQVMGVRG
ncbi:MAG: YjbQ family protein [Candidatus Eisenbacteria bacterium]|nr:YjbQ family protein [Candidatus Eisenbacteria bacterium]